MSPRPFNGACLHIEDVEVHQVKEFGEAALAALSLLLELSDEQRAKVLLHFCGSCGSANPYCGCDVCSGCRRDKSYCNCSCKGCEAPREDCFCKQLAGRGSR